jgi:hypothetical protein
MIFEAWFYESFRLVHVAYFVGVKQPIKKCSLDIELFNLPIKSSTKVS